MRTFALSFLLMTAIIGSVCFAQNYRCDWNVVGSGGGKMTSASYHAGTTAGQTGAGPMTGTAFLAMIGYWQTEYSVGIAEREPLPTPGSHVTALYAPTPNPFRGRVQLRYSLAAESDVLLEVFDRVGRHVRTLVSGRVPAGRYDITWDAADDRGKAVPRGIYFCRFRADDHAVTAKLMLGE